METKPDRAMLNEIWAKTLISQLIHQGVDYFCLAPGFRSTPLTLAIAENPKTKTFVHFDERGLCFHALGYAKAFQKPAAVLVTSGTAVGNLMPAVMEAYMDCVPMILLTCDRPAELRDCGANQATDQIKLFGDYVRYFFDFPSPHSDLPDNFLATTLAGAVARALFPIPGPIQLNCPFPEPFFSDEKTKANSQVSTHYFFPKQTLPDPQNWAEKIQKAEKGVIVLGKNAKATSAKILAEKLQWPLLPDITSHYREQGDPSAIAHYDSILKSEKNFKPNLILHLGGPVVSKVLLKWMSQTSPYIHVSENPHRCDPTHKVTDRIICAPSAFCEQLSELISQKGKTDWLSSWLEVSNTIKHQCSFPLYSEPGVLHYIKEKSAPNIALFFANSMPIRDADMFFFPQKPCGPIFANRGLSGIDGNIATIAGIATRFPVIALIGDQTALHDLNSFAQLKKTKHRVKLIIINNGGGGIFSFVAIGKRKDVLDPYFAAAHDRTFEDAARLFNLSYTTNLEEDADICEICTQREENVFLHQQFDQRIQCSFSCTDS